MILLQNHTSFVGFMGTSWNSQVETDILELGDRVSMCLDDESIHGGASALYWWRAEGWRNP